MRSQPTVLYGIFKTAELQKKTVGELLTGESFPYSNLEFRLSLVYNKAQARLQQENK